MQFAVYAFLQLFDLTLKSLSWLSVTTELTNAIKRVTVLLPENLHKTIKLFAVEKNLTMQKVFLDAIKTYIQECSKKE